MTQHYDLDDEELTETPEQVQQLAEAALVLSEMAIERGVTRLADLGDLPPLLPEVRAKYLARAHARLAEEEANDDDA